MPGLRRPVQAALAAGDRPIVFVGDGWSDRCASLACDRVFARDGLAVYLKTNACPTSRTTPCTTLLLRFPEPYDFELSTGRFRAFGTDLANRLVDGSSTAPSAVARFASSPVPAASTSSRSTTRRGRSSRSCSARRSTCRRSTSGHRTIALSHRSSSGCEDFGRRSQPDPFEALITSITAQQVSLFAAVAIRNRLVERFGIRSVRRGRSRPATESRPRGGRALRGRLHATEGRVRDRARAQRARPGSPARARR